MSAFLWIEDFENKQYREFANALFGRALNLRPTDFPDDEGELRAFLRDRQIVLVTTYAEAARLIDGRLSDFDYIVLDIDLNLLGEDWEEDRQYVDPLLRRWHQYDPRADNEEASYDAARQKMKMVAGYHLFVDLVMNRGFSRARILFCSNHGTHLDSIRHSFEPAKIEPPEIPMKGDERVKRWITEMFHEPYLGLRRATISACGEMLERLIHGQTRFLMPTMPGDEAATLTQADAAILLETLPKLLPGHVPPDGERGLAFRLFVRTLAQDWDKINFKDRELKLPEKAFAAVLKQARNWTSHDARALSRLDEGDVAFLLLIALRCCFELPRNKVERFELSLLEAVGEPTALTIGELKSAYENSFAEVEARYRKLPDIMQHPRSFRGMINDLQGGGRLDVDEQPRFLRQILWHELHRQREGKFSPVLEHFNKPIFLDELTRRIYLGSFG